MTILPWKQDTAWFASDLWLNRWSDGRLSLDDPSTGEHVDLEVFGPTNAETFARLWRAADDARS